MVRLLTNWPKNEKRLFFDLFGASYNEFRTIFPLKQPLPVFEKLDDDSKYKLNSALGAVSLETTEGYLYKPGIETTTAYLYFINKSHFLYNGNKRASIYGALGYLFLHKHFLETKWENIYKLAKEIAKSKSKDKIWPYILNFVDRTICEYNDSLFNKLVSSANTWVLKHPETY